MSKSRLCLKRYYLERNRESRYCQKNLEWCVNGKTDFNQMPSVKRFFKSVKIASGMLLLEQNSVTYVETAVITIPNNNSLFFFE